MFSRVEKITCDFKIWPSRHEASPELFSFWQPTDGSEVWRWNRNRGEIHDFFGPVMIESTYRTVPGSQRVASRAASRVARGSHRGPDFRVTHHHPWRCEGLREVTLKGSKGRLGNRGNLSWTGWPSVNCTETKWETDWKTEWIRSTWFHIVS